MKKIICPNCGEVGLYYVTETVTRNTVFDKNEDVVDHTGERSVYRGKIKRCLKCDKEVEVIEDKEDMGNA